jgi:1-deoxy-D-xylulose-5-phosphate reductoisomerase
VAGYNPSRRRVAVLGSTGSIGTSTLDVVSALPDRLQVVGLVAHTNGAELARQCRKFRPRVAILTDRKAFDEFDKSQIQPHTQLQYGDDAVAELAQASDVDVVLSAVVGAAGLRGTWAAVEAGKTVALANKESLVVAGGLLTELAKKTGSQFLPVDSEHSAIFQALTGAAANSVQRVVLTASGGPFRGKSKAELEQVTVEQALKHPTWQMGPKITIDSATLMNKALEIIEAKWLFGLNEYQLDVIVHPESIIHSFVEFVDGSVLAQLSPPDMRLPIQYALLYPERLPGPTKRLNWQQLSCWNFEQPDREAFPALDLGFEVVRNGGTCGAVLNAANEAAVARFLQQQLAFADISRCCADVLHGHDYDSSPTLERLQKLDGWARQEVARWIRT